METRIFEDFEIIDGKEKIMISAPHGFIHMKEGDVLPGETATDTITIDVAEKTKCYAIYKNISSDKDANYDKVCDYKKECLKTVKRSKIYFLIDIHGMDSCNEYDICLGTNDYLLLDNDKELVNKIKDIFIKNGFKKVSIDDPFKADTCECVARFIHDNASIKTLQIEINGKYRLKDSKDINIEGLEKALSDIIKIVKASAKS